MMRLYHMRTISFCLDFLAILLFKQSFDYICKIIKFKCSISSFKIVGHIVFAFSNSVSCSEVGKRVKNICILTKIGKLNLISSIY